MGASFKTPPAETHLECRHHLVHRDTANAATNNMILDALLKIVRETGSSNNTKQLMMGSEYSGIEVHGRRLTI